MDKLYQYLDKKTLTELFGYADTNQNGILDQGDTLTHMIPARRYKGDITEEAKTLTRTVLDEYLQSTESFEKFLSDLTMKRVSFSEGTTALSGIRVYMALSYTRPSTNGLAELWRLDLKKCPKGQCSGSKDIPPNPKDVRIPLITSSESNTPEINSCEEYVCELHLQAIQANWINPSAWLYFSIYDYERCLEMYPEK